MQTDTLNDIKNDDYRNVNVVKGYTGTNAINSSDYDYVYSFLYKYTSDRDKANLLSNQIFEVSEISGMSPIEIIDSMKGKSGMSLTATLIYYLNGIRTDYSQLGIHNIAKPNFYAGRNVLI